MYTFSSNSCILNLNKENPNSGSYRSYLRLAKSGVEEPLTTYADHYTFNFAYNNAAYSKGAVFLAQLGYVIGEENLQKTIKKYYEDFKFKHPVPNDIKRTAEKVSGLQLDWYLNYWAKTTATIDYAVDRVDSNKITLKRVGKMPMPIDLKITYVDNTQEDFNIPLRMMLGAKPTSATILNDWSWTSPTYSFTTEKVIKSVEIDPSHLMADIDNTNNSFSIEKE